MHKVAAVIGMNYGDEGKGHITNYLSGPKTLNVRFNGGAQAAHAVFLSDNRSHIFHHYGSGTLQGARTLFGSHFIVNPIIFAQETYSLSEKVGLREVFSDPRCRVTTPFDMVLNQYDSAHHNKTDTCGLGINETVTRSQYKQLNINMQFFMESSDEDLINALNVIEKEYLPFRLDEKELNFKGFHKFLSDESINFNLIVEKFIDLRNWMRDKLILVYPDDALITKFIKKSPERNIVFEASQGLLLDQNRTEFMPYLTRSNTGLTNVLEMLKTFSEPFVFDIYLITRTYLTRHGDGPIWNEHNTPVDNIDESTNPENQYQGKMRYGYLNMEWYHNAIKEMEDSKPKPTMADTIDVGVAMTCCDHVGPEFKYSLVPDGSLVKGKIDDFPKIKLKSYGRFETDIIRVEGSN
jgi:adenylosuccinate synthase